MAGFNTAVRQMIEMFQWPKCLCKKWPKYFNEKKNRCQMFLSASQTVRCIAFARTHFC